MGKNRSHGGDRHHHHHHHHHHGLHRHHQHHHHRHNNNPCGGSTEVIFLNTGGSCYNDSNLARAAWSNEQAYQRMQEDIQLREFERKQAAFQKNMRSAVLKDDVVSFGAMARQNQTYLLCDLNNTVEDNTLFLIAQSLNPIAFLEAAKDFMTIDDTNYLVDLILKRSNSQVQVNQDFEMLGWLLQYDVSQNHSTALNQLAVACYFSHIKLAIQIFSHMTVGAFYSLEQSRRMQILKTVELASSTLLIWYSDQNNVFYAQILVDDLAALNEHQAALNTMWWAARQQLTFEALHPNLLSWLLEPNMPEESQLILKHLVRFQPQLLAAVPIEKKSILFKRICDIYDETYAGRVDKHRLLSYERSLLAQVKTAFEHAPSAQQVVDFALQLESQWKQDRLSDKGIEVMLKLAKTNILSRLKTGSDAPNEQLAQFLGKHRTTYHFFCASFHLSFFSTTSTKTYQLYNDHEAFYQAVDKDVEKGLVEYNAFMR